MNHDSFTVQPGKKIRLRISGRKEAVEERVSGAGGGLPLD